jgi:hypothetical protein
MIDRPVHSRQHIPVLAHAEIVVIAPHSYPTALTIRHVPQRGREFAGTPFGTRC